MNSLDTKTTIEAIIAAAFAQLMSQPRITKRSAVRLSIASVITENALAPGDLLPAETRLAKVLGVSLGTVQSALRELQQYDIITRRRGDGTRVASAEVFSGDVWHFRFLDKQTGNRITIAQSEVDVERTEADGPWHAYFGKDKTFTRIVRRLKLEGSVAVGAEMVLPCRIAPTLSQVQAAELQMLNIRQFLKHSFGIQTSCAKQYLETFMPSQTEQSLFDLEPESLAFQIVAIAHAPDGQPVYFQRVIAPCDRCSFAF